MAVAGQTFYSFILDNLRSLGALKAMGGKQWTALPHAIIASFYRWIFRIWHRARFNCSFGFSSLKTGQPPFYMPYMIPLFTLGLVILICFAAALLSIRRISQLEAAEVFRA